MASTIIMPIALGVLYNFALPYWDTLNKKLSERGISSLTILHAPNLVGHPLFIGALVALGLFALPQDLAFYASWFGMVVLAAISLTLHIWGLVKTRFFGVQVLSKLDFLMATIAAIFLLGEKVSPLQAFALGIAALAILVFAWPTTNERVVVWDSGVLFVILSQAINAFGTILYKTASLHTGSYWSFLSGRLTADLVAWTLVWVVGLTLINRAHPLRELRRFFDAPEGHIAAAGESLSNLADSYLIYALPVVTISILSTLTVPAAYFWSQITYKEELPARTWIGAALGLVSIILFIYPA